MCTALKIEPDSRDSHIRSNSRTTFANAPESRSHAAILQNAQPPSIEISFFSRALNYPYDAKSWAGGGNVLILKSWTRLKREVL
jgi:hypothetical protein